MQSLGHCIGYQCAFCHNTWVVDKFDLRMGDVDPVIESCPYCEKDVCQNEICMEEHNKSHVDV